MFPLSIVTAVAGKPVAAKVKETAKPTPMQSEDLFAESATQNVTPAPAQQQPEPVKKTASVPETQLSVSPEVNPVVESATVVPTEAAIEPVVVMTESSPRKSSTRLCNLVRTVMIHTQELILICLILHRTRRRIASKPTTRQVPHCVQSHLHI